ncbi:MAG: tail fiber protein [Rudaea sp.]|nr:tail fiber protein [Rudaea sp.]
MSQPFLGQIGIFAFNFAPTGWALCNGQTLPIQQNAALFSILGTTYGGNGTTTFQLPNLQSRTPIAWGNGSGLTPRVIGQVGGEENHTLLLTELPVHTHTLQAASAAATTGLPAGNALAVPASVPVYRAGATTTVTLNPASIGPNSGGQPHTNIQPYAVVNFCIALVGIFPSRN